MTLPASVHTKDVTNEGAATNFEIGRDTFGGLDFDLHYSVRVSTERIANTERSTGFRLDSSHSVRRQGHAPCRMLNAE